MTEAWQPLPWQSEQWRDGLRQLRAGRLPHALLLSGVPGTGRGHFATALARTLLCAAATDSGFCGTCKACALAEGGTHADFLRVAPEETGKAIGVDAVRRALGFAAGTATQGARKVMLLAPAEQMTTAAYNAFLKCLEEPSPETYILLVSAQGAALPATIRSRCQHWQLDAPDTAMAAAWIQDTLASAAPADAATVERYLRLFGPAPLQIVAQLESGEGDALLALDAALGAGQGGYQRVAAERCAADIEPDRVLLVVERAVQSWLREQGASALRSAGGRRAFNVLDVIAKLRAARAAGSNPNPDLLRFRVLQAYSGLWQP